MYKNLKKILLLFKTLHIIYTVGDKMIFNWKEHCQKILKDKAYGTSDRWERKEEYKQQIALCYYLHKELKLNKANTYKKWMSIPNKFNTMIMSSELSDRTKELELKEYFDKVYEKSLKFKMRDVNKQLEIYQEEIDAINNLEADETFRKYIYVLLGVCKFYNAYYGKCYLDHKLRGYAYECVSNGKKYGDYVQTLVNTNRKCGPVIISARTKMRNISSLSMLKTSGTVVRTFVTPNDLIKWINKDILTRKAICPICGQEYEVTSKTKRDCCLDCWKIKEKLRIKEAVAKSRKKKEDM